MDIVEKTKRVVIERGTVAEKRIPEGGYWWQYRVVSVTRHGLKSKWMDAIVFWEHVILEDDENDNPPSGGFAVGTEVYYFMFGDGRGAILDRVSNSKADYDSKMGIWVDFMNEMREQHREMLEKLDALKTQISTAQTDIKGHVTTEATGIKGHVTTEATGIKSHTTDARDHIETHVTNARDHIETHVTNARDHIENHVTDAKVEIKTHVTEARDHIETHVTNARDHIESHVTAAKTEIKNHVTDARDHIEGKIADSETTITTAISTAKGDLESKLTDIKNLEDDIWDKLNE